ncbi:MAG: type II toxin-antitoxin system Phd/YefM family antitoxin [Clostridia bacterium]|nr:type II toxin-antitoxin system Phd/YefM family antitoxin [Clostridia bacterium]
MMVDTKQMIAMTDANQNFSKVVRMVDSDGMAVILKNNQPRYIVVDFSEYEAIAASLQMRKSKINAAAEAVLEENMTAFLELAK